MNQQIRVRILQLAVITGICGFLFFFGLGAFGLVGADEPRYAQIAREMFTRHDWIVPTLNGQPWLEKPAFLYWKMMNSYGIFGVADWAARVPAAAHALTLVLVVFFFMRRFRPGTEMDAALITASSAAIIGFARGASTDMLLSSHFAMAMLAWWAWHVTRRKIWLAFFYTLLSLGALSKGPVAPALAVLMVGAYALLRRDKKAFLGSLWWPGFLLFFAIALPWYVAVQIKAPQFFGIFFIEHNLERFGTNLYQHSQPFWYYIPVFLLSMLPWTVFTIMAIVQSGKSEIRRLRTREVEDGRDDGLQLFLLLWMIIPIFFFSISRSKLPGYILPAIPAAALLTADYLHRSLLPLKRWAMVLHSMICGSLVAAALLAPSRILKVHPAQNVQAAVLLGAGVMAVLVLLIVRLGGPGVLHFATLIPVIVVLAFLLRPAAPVIDEANSARTVDAQLRHLGAPPGPIAVFNVKREVEYGLNFYRNQPIGRYERDGIPQESHLLVAREGNKDAVQALVGSRQIALFGSFPPQHLEFFLVSKR
ncbi:MAG TPA: glycosyltransferase family 39 protein [Candidatus Angelobacter sp.]|nr:glycosyltransferase family 39 protein [Candidatus Angelobacter sp.]